MSAIATKASVEVVSMADEHAEAVAEFFRIVGWDPDATSEKVERGRKLAIQANPFFPGSEAPTVLFLSDGKVLGYVTSIPILVWSNGEERRAEWIKGVMVHPDHRNGPIGFLLLKELMKRLVCPLSLSVSDAVRRLFSALGMTDHGTIPNYLRLLNAGTVLKTLDLEAVGISLPNWLASVVRFAQKTGLATIAGACIGCAIQVKALVASSSTRGLQVDSPCVFPDRADLDGLWHLVRREIAAAAIRDGRYLTWRYGDGAVYQAIAVREAGTLVGFAVVRHPRSEGDQRLHGIRIATLSDLLFPPSRPEIAVALLKKADVVARLLGADALLCSASHPAVHAALSRRGYLRAPANVHFLSKNAAEFNPPGDFLSWWLTRGDTNADEVF
jgi:ribosomal protein S18 acetylase RimI-like enzyme